MKRFKGYKILFGFAFMMCLLFVNTNNVRASETTGGGGGNRYSKEDLYKENINSGTYTLQYFEYQYYEDNSSYQLVTYGGNVDLTNYCLVLYQHDTTSSDTQTKNVYSYRLKKYVENTIVPTSISCSKETKYHLSSGDDNVSTTTDTLQYFNMGYSVFLDSTLRYKYDFFSNMPVFATDAEALQYFQYGEDTS